MKTVTAKISISCLVLLLSVLLLAACAKQPNTPAATDTISPTDTLSESEVHPETLSETEEETMPETHPDTLPETLPESITETETFEDPALNVFPTEGQNIDIGIFFEPGAEYQTPEQYDRIRDAHITFVESVNPTITKEMAEAQAKLCEERGIRFSYYPLRDGVDLLTKSENSTVKYLERLVEDMPNVTDIHLIDEPHNPWAYVPTYKAIVKAGLTPRLNFLPYNVTAVFENYRGHVEDTIIAVGKEDYKYLSYDQYPFGNAAGSIPDMFYNLNLFREIGLKYGVDTAFYIQSCGQNPGFRRLNGGEIRYHTSAGLAYGLKSMTYFTWFTTGYCEPAYYAIISPYGEKTDIYDDVCAINAQILTTGRLLRRLDAVEVFHTKGTESAIDICDRTDVALYPEATDARGFIVSQMRDRENGREYVMLVNKNFNMEVTASVAIASDVHYLYNCTNGTYETVDIASGSFELTLPAGGYALFAVGQHDRIIRRSPDTGANIAEGKPVAVDAVNPGNGYYAYCLTDGIRDNAQKTALGFRSADKTGYVEIDLGRPVTLNRVDIYTTGTVYNRGELFPKSFTIELSGDRENWTVVVTETDYDATGKVPVFTFEATEARYVRINVTESPAVGYYELAEIEIYCDDGSIPAPDDTFFTPPTYTPGSNIATDANVKVICSSAYEEGTFWRISGINDGRRFDVVENGNTYCGYSSNVFVNEKQDGATEWIGYDLGAEFPISSLVVYPAKNSQATPQGFPLSYCVEISSDGEHWTSILDVENDPDAGKMEAHTLTFDTVTTRYIRFRGTKLTGVGANALFGYMLQLSEIEVIVG